MIEFEDGIEFEDVPLIDATDHYNPTGVVSIARVARGNKHPVDAAFYLYSIACSQVGIPVGVYFVENGATLEVWRAWAHYQQERANAYRLAFRGSNGDMAAFFAARA